MVKARILDRALPPFSSAVRITEPGAASKDVMQRLQFGFVFTSLTWTVRSDFKNAVGGKVVVGVATM